MKWHAYTLNTEIPLNTSAYTKKAQTLVMGIPLFPPTRAPQ
jgi:hypothetical protein